MGETNINNKISTALSSGELPNQGEIKTKNDKELCAKPPLNWKNIEQGANFYNTSNENHENR